MALLKVRSQHLSGVTEESHKNLQSGQPFSGQRFEPATSQMQSRSDNHSGVTFDVVGQKMKTCQHILKKNVIFCHSPFETENPVFIPQQFESCTHLPNTTCLNSRNTGASEGQNVRDLHIHTL